jgi:surfeit locus 1 family protein
MSSRTLRFLLVTLATVITMAVTGSLGLWQLGRAQQKLELQERIEAQGRLSTLDEGDLLAAADPLSEVHRPVRLRGEWLAEASVFLDNRQMNARTGFFLVTPLRLQGSTRAVLVQRGWVPRDFTDRSRLPRIDTAAGAVEIVGRLAPPPGQLYQLSTVDQGPIRQNIELSAFAQENGLELLLVSVLETEAAADGLLREWPTTALGVERHHGYAFQWFGLCALAGFLYVWFQFIAPRLKRSSHVPDA